jgi:steroid delta-isomerase-like uncharacterized protein
LQLLAGLDDEGSLIFRRLERRSIEWNDPRPEAIMSTEANKALIKRHFDAFNAGDLEAFAATFTEDSINHAAIPQAQGRQGARTIATKLRAAFPDMQMSVDDAIAEGDRVVCRLTVTGTHEGALDFVKLKLPATGKRIRTTHIHVFRIASGAIAERWAERDDVAMLRQLGVMSTVAAAAEVRS